MIRYVKGYDTLLSRVKKWVSERVLRRAMHIIRSETLGKTLGERKKSRQKSYRESRLDSWWDPRQDSWRDVSRSPSVSLESQIGLYAWLLTRLSPRLVFFRGLRRYVTLGYIVKLSYAMLRYLLRRIGIWYGGVASRKIAAQNLWFQSDRKLKIVVFK